jgi:hypothetical protein
VSRSKPRIPPPSKPNPLLFSPNHNLHPNPNLSPLAFLLVLILTLGGLEPTSHFKEQKNIIRRYRVLLCFIVSGSPPRPPIRRLLSILLSFPVRFVPFAASREKINLVFFVTGEKSTPL